MFGWAEVLRERIETARAGKALLDDDVDGRAARLIRAKLDFCAARALDAELVLQMAAAAGAYDEVAGRLRKQARLSQAGLANVEPCDFRALAEKCEERARRYRICALLGDPPEEPAMTAVERDTATILQVKERAGLAPAPPNPLGPSAAVSASLPAALPTAPAAPAAPPCAPCAAQADHPDPGSVPRIGLRRSLPMGGGKLPSAGLFGCLAVEEDIKKASGTVIEQQRLTVYAPALLAEGDDCGAGAIPAEEGVAGSGGGGIAARSAASPPPPPPPPSAGSLVADLRISFRQRLLGASEEPPAPPAAASSPSSAVELAAADAELLGFSSRARALVRGAGGDGEDGEEDDSGRHSTDSIHVVTM